MPCEFFHIKSYNNNMLRWLKSTLLYAQSDPADIRNVRKVIAQKNLSLLKSFSAVSSCAFGVALIAGLSANISGITQKIIGYGLGFTTSLIIFLCAKFIAPRFRWILKYLTMGFEVSLYALGLFLTFVSSPQQLTITLFALFLIVPQLFTDRPYRAVLVSLTAAIVFTTLYLFTDIKPQEIRMQEMVNMTIFFILGIFLGVYVKKSNFERFIFEYKLNQSNSIERQMQLEQWEAMADIYVSMAQIDLKKNTYMLIRKNQYIPLSVGVEESNFSKTIVDTMTATTDEGHLEGVLNFVDTSTLTERLKDKRTITHEFLGKNFGWCRARFIAVDSKNEKEVRRVIYVVENINEQRNRENRLTTMAETDAMTGLFNRHAGSTKIKEHLYNHRKGMLCLFDVDHFKFVNDNFGHQTGDQVIIAVAQAMKKAFRDNDVLLRLGGDEFVVFANGIQTEELGTKIIQRFFDILDQARIPGHEDYRISISLGATFTTEDATFEDLYKQADTCTYQSKKIQGKSLTFFRG